MDKSIWRGTIILTVSAFFIKILSAIYRLPYQNLAGDVGFYVYQQVYPFYALASVMGGFGFPVILSKMVAECKKEDETARQTVFKTALTTLGAAGVFLFLILFLGAPLMAFMMGDRQLTSLFRIISFIFLFMPLLAVFRGYFQGAQYMLPTGISQITEQTIRVSVILGLSLYLFSQGAGPYAFGSAAALGSMIAPLFAAGVLLIFYFKGSGPKIAKNHRGRWDMSLSLRFLKEGLAYTLTALSIVFFQLADALTIVPLLNHHHGLDGRALKGIYDRSYPLIQMGLTVAVALSTAIIPMIAKLRENKDKEELKRNISQALRTSILVGGAASVGLFSIIKEVNIMLFENNKGTSALALMALCIVAASIVVTGASILQSTGMTFRPVVYLLTAFLLKIVLNLLLIPAFGITGAAAATLMGLLYFAALLAFKIRTVYDINFYKKNEWMKLVLVLAVLLLSVSLWKLLLTYGFGCLTEGRSGAAIVALTSVVIGACMFLTSILRLGLISWEEMEHFPGGKRLKSFFANHSR
ncbi:MAG: putative polysaccharide biosynthesis protein [Tuberibacillus sp.]